MIFKRLILILTIFVLLCFIVNFSKQVIRLWEAGKIVGIKEDELRFFKKENLNLKKELEKVKSPGFIEETAREKLGMTKEGEKVVILPININNTNSSINTSERNEVNWEKWWRLFIY